MIAVSYDQLTWPQGYESQILGLMEQVASAKHLNSQVWIPCSLLMKSSEWDALENLLADGLLPP